MSSTSTADVELVGDETVLNVARAAMFAALIGALAYVSFPFPGTPIPVTLQVLGVFLAGILLGPVWGAAALVLYLAAGAVGAPVFSGGSSGLGILLGGQASFGYLWSYPVAAALIGVVVHGGLELGNPSAASLPRLVGAMAAGTVVIYLFGMVGIMVVTGGGVVSAFTAGVLPFIPAEIVKMAAAVGVVRSDAIRAE